MSACTGTRTHTQRSTFTYANEHMHIHTQASNCIQAYTGTHRYTHAQGHRRATHPTCSMGTCLLAWMALGANRMSCCANSTAWSSHARASTVMGRGAAAGHAVCECGVNKKKGGAVPVGCITRQGEGLRGFCSARGAQTLRQQVPEWDASASCTCMWASTPPEAAPARTPAMLNADRRLPSGRCQRLGHPGARVST